MPASAAKQSSASTSRELEQQQPKRRRISYACDYCRAKKNRCDGERPQCSPCRKRQLECVYSVQRPRSSVTQEYVDNITARNRILEQQLATHISTAQNPPTSASADGNEFSSIPRTSLIQNGDCRNGFAQSSSEQAASHARISTPTASFSHAAPTYQAQAQRSIPGNQTRDSVNNEIHFNGSVDSISQGEQWNSARKPAGRGPLTDPPENSTEYFGECSTFDFMTKICSPKEDEPEQDSASVRRQAPGWVDSSLAMASTSEPIFEGLVLGTGTDDPFGLPPRFLADKLVDAFFKFRHPLNTYLHEPSFRKRYERLWLSGSLGGEEATEANLAWIGLVNIVFTFGSAHEQLASRISVNRARFFKRARTLVFSGLLQAGSIDLVQALLLMGHYLHGSLELNNCWTVVGLAIRMAQGLGLHLDASTFTSDVVEQEVRKRVWWACFVLDRMLSMKVGRPPTIHDGPSIEVSLPLAVDDEFLTNDASKPPAQPPNVPSKLDFIIQAVPQCRLLERICDMLYSQHQTDTPKTKFADIPKLLSKAIELDGDLVAWQQALPAHLKADSKVEGWHFERQQSTLIMRFLNSRLLLHRQILLIYVTRSITDSFQREILYCCVRRCIVAAHDTISQIRLLRQRHLLHYWWHNSYYVFTALVVLLAFQTLDETSKRDVCLPESIDVDQVVVQGTELLEEVGCHFHPIAARYLESLRRMEAKLKTLSASRAKVLELRPLPTTLPAEDMQRSLELNSFSESMDGDFGGSVHQTADTSMWLGEDFSEIENMFYSTGWFGKMGEWNESLW